MVTSKDGRVFSKREVTIADDTVCSMVVTIWGRRARQEDVLFEGFPVIALRGVAVKAVSGGLSGSLLEGGTLVFGPSVPEAQSVRRWWAADGASQPLRELTPISRRRADFCPNMPMNKEVTSKLHAKEVLELSA